MSARHRCFYCRRGSIVRLARSPYTPSPKTGQRGLRNRPFNDAGTREVRRDRQVRPCKRPRDAKIPGTLGLSIRGGEHAPVRTGEWRRALLLYREQAQWRNPETLEDRGGNLSGEYRRPRHFALQYRIRHEKRDVRVVGEKAPVFGPLAVLRLGVDHAFARNDDEVGCARITLRSRKGERQPRAVQHAADAE